MEEEIALKAIRHALAKWTLRRRTREDANGRVLPDGEKTKFLPSGTDGVALEVTLEEDGEVASTRVEKSVHELRVCKLDTLILRDKSGMTGEQLLAMIALMATFDVVLMTNSPPGEALSAASTMKNLLAHHSGDGFELILLPTTTVFLRLPLAVLKSKDEIVFYDSRFKTQEKIKCLRVDGDSVVISDGEEAATDDSLDVHDGWLGVPTGRTVEVQRVGLEVQIAEEAEEQNGIELFCCKLVDEA